MKKPARLFLELMTQRGKTPKVRAEAQKQLRRLDAEERRTGAVARKRAPRRLQGRKPTTMSFTVQSPCRLLGPTCAQRRTANPEGWPLYAWCPQCLMGHIQAIEAAVLTSSRYAAHLEKKLKTIERLLA